MYPYFFIFIFSVSYSCTPIYVHESLNYRHDSLIYSTVIVIKAGLSSWEGRRQTEWHTEAKGGTTLIVL